MTKTCKLCSQTKDIKFFYKSSTCRLGVRNVCKKCQNLQRVVYNKIYRQTHREWSRAYHRHWHQLHKEMHLKWARRWKQNNPKKVLAYQRKWTKRNPGKVRSHRTLTLARRLKRVPSWVIKNPTILSQIERIYQNRPKGYHVDHIIPLCGKLVSGLHVPWNLQYLPAHENRKKYNSFNPEDTNVHIWATK
jgi:hypothetical protein